MRTTVLAEAVRNAITVDYSEVYPVLFTGEGIGYIRLHAPTQS